MKSATSALGTVIALCAAAVLAGCGGGGGAGSPQSLSGPLPPRATSQPQITGGPVGYLQSNGPLTSSGSIAGGSQNAIVAVMSSASQSGKSFSLDSLNVSTAGSSGSSRFAWSTRRSVAAPRVVHGEAFAADDSELLNKLSQHAVYGSRPMGRVHTMSGTLPQQPVVGSTADIWVQQGANTTYSSQVPSTLVAQTAHGNIWLDDTLLHTDAQAGAAQIAADFENAYASDTQHFASPDYPASAPGLQANYQTCDSSGGVTGSGPAYIDEPADRRINVMVVNPNDLGGYGGYFSGANLMNQSALNCLNGNGTNYQSNQAPFIFVGWFDSQGGNYELQEDLVRGTAHEFQHLINFVNHAILAAGASTPGFNGNESAYINEGLSMLAQDLAVQRLYGAQGVKFDVDDAMSRASAYLAAPGNFSITAFTGIDGYSYGGGGTPQYNCFGGCYGGAYLFQRYLRDRFGGDSYTHAMETSGSVGEQNLGYVTGESAGSLLDDFALAMAADTLGVQPTSSRFAFGSLGLTQTYTDQFGASKSPGGVYAVPINGSSSTVQAPVGGFTFVSVGSVPSAGLPVSVTDRQSVSGFSLAGGLAEH
ncbi:MAG TPA: hypothetical protein VFA29_08145 [Candidatus Baltobacteraceae bacterium]|nr:hypothetical protein [Candidatus Baltobacteraceae bacterium]